MLPLYQNPWGSNTTTTALYVVCSKGIIAPLLVYPSWITHRIEYDDSMIQFFRHKACFSFLLSAIFLLCIWSCLSHVTYIHVGNAMGCSWTFYLWYDIIGPRINLERHQLETPMTNVAFFLYIRWPTCCFWRLRSHVQNKLLSVLVEIQSTIEVLIATWTTYMMAEGPNFIMLSSGVCTLHDCYIQNRKYGEESHFGSEGGVFISLNCQIFPFF